MTAIPATETHSTTSNGASTVERLAAVPLPPRRLAAVAPNPPLPELGRALEAQERRINHKIEHSSKVLAVISALAAVLSVRLYLFVVLIGAFVLGLIALDKGTWIALSVLVAYATLTVIPLCVLDDRLHRRPDQ